MRSYNGQADLSAMTDLVFDNPDYHLHVVDLAYRLTAGPLEDPANVALWADEKGKLVAWAISQRPFAALDYAIRPGNLELETHVLQWGKDRWQTIANQRQEKAYCYVGLRNDQPECFTQLADYGFQGDKWSLLHMARPAADPIPDWLLPDGFTIRPLAGIDEVGNYVALHRAAFGSENMTVEWRARILQSPHYTTDLDLVAIAPDGTFAAFCIGWQIDVQGKRLAQVEPIGVHPAFQSHGLGKAILAEQLRRMRAHNADTFLIEAESTNAASQGLYRSMGFRSLYETDAYFQVFEPQTVK